MKLNYAASIRALDDERLEAFVKDWAKRRTRDYVEVERFSTTGDMGRDVVGYVTELRLDGPWDNFQCKQLKNVLYERAAFVELGKIFMHAANGAFTVPRSYTFVAPRGVARKVKDYIASPKKFREAFLQEWHEHCAPHLVDNKVIPLTTGIADAINRFAFERVYSLDAEKLADDASAAAVLVEWFGYDPGPSPKGMPPPAEPLDEEAVYIDQLIGLYGDREGMPFANFAEALSNPNWGRHLLEQRRKFFDAAEFDRFYRDSTPPTYLANFKEELLDGVAAVYVQTHVDGLERALKVLAHASQVSCSGVLGRHARVSVKQGACHQFANEGKLPWRG